MADHKIGLKDAIQAAYDELHQAITEIPRHSDLNFVYQNIELEFTVEVTHSADAKAGVRVWVLEAGAEASQRRTKAHMVRVLIEPRSGGVYRPRYMAEHLRPTSRRARDSSDFS